MLVDSEERDRLMREALHRERQWLLAIHGRESLGRWVKCVEDCLELLAGVCGDTYAISTQDDAFSGILSIDFDTIVTAVPCFICALNVSRNSYLLQEIQIKISHIAKGQVLKTKMKLPWVLNQVRESIANLNQLRSILHRFIINIKWDALAEDDVSSVALIKMQNDLNQLLVQSNAILIQISKRLTCPHKTMEPFATHPTRLSVHQNAFEPSLGQDVFVEFFVLHGQLTCALYVFQPSDPLAFSGLLAFTGNLGNGNIRGSLKSKSKHYSTLQRTSEQSPDDKQIISTSLLGLSTTSTRKLPKSNSQPELALSTHNESRTDSTSLESSFNSVSSYQGPSAPSQTIQNSENDSPKTTTTAMLAQEATSSTPHNLEKLIKKQYFRRMITSPITQTKVWCVYDLQVECGHGHTRNAYEQVLESVEQLRSQISTWIGVNGKLEQISFSVLQQPRE